MAGVICYVTTCTKVTVIPPLFILEKCARDRRTVVTENLRDSEDTLKGTYKRVAIKFYYTLQLSPSWENILLMQDRYPRATTSDNDKLCNCASR